MFKFLLIFHCQKSCYFEKKRSFFLSLQADHRAHWRLQDPAGPLRCAEPRVRQASVQAGGGRPLRPDLEAGRPPGQVLGYRYQGPVPAGLLVLRPRPLRLAYLLSRIEIISFGLNLLTPCLEQCCGSGSESGSTCFWASWFRIQSISQRYGFGSCSGSFYHNLNVVRKTLISTVFLILFDFFMFEK
jgi:hypothetical protein